MGATGAGCTKLMCDRRNGVRVSATRDMLNRSAGGRDAGHAQNMHLGTTAPQNDDVVVALIFCTIMIALCMAGIACSIRCPPDARRVFPLPRR